MIKSNLVDSSWTILCDFDGTVTRGDVTDALIASFGDADCETLEEAWKRGDIGSRVCMSGQVSRLAMNQRQLDQALDTIQIDPGFPTFVKTAQALGIEVLIVSDGLDYAIRRILSRHGLNNLPVFANVLEALGTRRWGLAFPFAQDDCVAASGHCKCGRAAIVREQGQKVLVIGDGTSDFCVAAQADLVWAKDRLIQHCERQGLPFQPFSSFTEARAWLPDLLSGHFFPSGVTHDQERRIST